MEQTGADSRVRGGSVDKGEQSSVRWMTVESLDLKSESGLFSSDAGCRVGTDRIVPG